MNGCLTITSIHNNSWPQCLETHMQRRCKNNWTLVQGANPTIPGTHAQREPNNADAGIIGHLDREQTNNSYHTCLETHTQHRCKNNWTPRWGADPTIPRTHAMRHTRNADAGIIRHLYREQTQQYGKLQTPPTTRPLCSESEQSVSRRLKPAEQG